MAKLKETRFVCSRCGIEKLVIHSNDQLASDKILHARAKTMIRKEGWFAGIRSALCPKCDRRFDI